MIWYRNFKHLLLRCIPGGYKDPEIPLKLRCNKDVTFRFCKSMVFSFTLNTLKLAYDKFVKPGYPLYCIGDCDPWFKFLRSMVQIPAVHSSNLVLIPFPVKYQVPWWEWLSDCRISERWLISKSFIWINDNHTKSNHGCPSDKNRKRSYFQLCLQLWASDYFEMGMA